MTTHTQAPWRYESPDEVCIRDAEGGRVAILTNLRGALGMSGRRDPNEVIANARLIAAAPDLLDTLREVVAFWDAITMEDCVNDIHVKARAAITKATGSQIDAGDAR